MSRPLLLDLFCGAGGAAAGYHRAGFDVLGVDLHSQAHYPFNYLRADALQVLHWLKADGTFRVRIGGQIERWGPFDAIHASPPCQGYSQASACQPGLADQYPRLLPRVREACEVLDLPYIIENVAGARRHMITPILLCGAMFGRPLYRHRLFESNLILTAPVHPKHTTKASPAGHWRPGTLVSVAGNCAPIALAREAMDMGWTDRFGLKEAIPPAFTEYLGQQLLAALSAEAVA